MPLAAASKTALIQTNVLVDQALIAKHTGAVKIRSMQHEGGWMHMIKCDQEKEFDSFNAALQAIENELKPRSKCLFRTILDDGGITEGKIVLSPTFMQNFKPEKTWRRTQDQKPEAGKPRKREPKQQAPNKKRAIDPLSDALAAKEETIKALNAALDAKEELIRAQAALIASLQK